MNMPKNYPKKATYGKLVRDKIPEITKASGSNPVTRILDDKEYLKELIKKLEEEVKEFKDEPSAEELADIQEITIALRLALGLKAKELENIRKQKAAKNGSFKKRIFLERTE